MAQVQRQFNDERPWELEVPTGAFVAARRRLNEVDKTRHLWLIMCSGLLEGSKVPGAITSRGRPGYPGAIPGEAKAYTCGTVGTFPAQHVCEALQTRQNPHTMAEKKQHVVFFHPDLGIGGAERLVVDAAVGLQERGHKVTIFTSHCDPAHCFDEARDGKLPVVLANPRAYLNGS